MNNNLIIFFINRINNVYAIQCLRPEDETCFEFHSILN